MKLLIVNGPNLNRLGKREPEIYGEQSFEEYFRGLQLQLKNVELSYYQSNHEGEIIDQLHQSEEVFAGVILNAGAYSHTSIAIADAIKSIAIPVVEVHISNIFDRESFRHKSYISPVSRGTISGFGLKGYELAIKSFIDEEK